MPSYLPIDSIEQLNSIAGGVDGKIIGIETGSGLYRDTERAIKAYSLNYQLTGDRALVAGTWGFNPALEGHVGALMV